MFALSAGFPRHTQRTDRADLCPQDIDEMWRLYAPHHRVSRAQFCARLDARSPSALDRIHRFRVRGELVGFVGFRADRFRIGGRETTAMCMGLGFIVREHRGRNLIQRAVVREIVGHWLRHPGVPLCFWTDALTYKPYLLIARNLRRYHPRRGPEDANLSALRDAIGARFYGGSYRGGVVTDPGWWLAEGVGAISARDLRDPDVRYYLAQNPGNPNGDGLLVVLRADLSDLLGWLYRSAWR